MQTRKLITMLLPQERGSEIHLQEARNRVNKSKIESLCLKIELKKLEMISQGSLAPQGDGSMSGAGGEPL